MTESNLPQKMTRDYIGLIAFTFVLYCKYVKLLKNIFDGDFTTFFEKT